MTVGEVSKDAAESRQIAADLEAAVAKADEAEERYRVLFENLGDAVLVADATTGEIVDCNRGAEMLLRRSRDEIVGLHQTDLHPPEEKDTWRERFREHADESSDFLDSEIVTESGSRVPVSISASVVMLGGKKHVLGIFRNITDRKRAEEERTELEHRLLHSQKMQAIGALAGGIAHDFNNLLTPILGHTDMLEQDSEPGSEISSTARAIRMAAQRASDLATQLLGFARKGKLVSKPVDMHKTISNTVAILGRTINRRITVSLLMEADCSAVMGDPSQLEQVVMNLAVNARDAMPDGGELGFHTKAVDLDEEYCRARGDVNAGRHLMFSVKDTGLGMSPEVRDRVFEPFYTTKREGEGTGMGLAMVYGIIANHSGAISVRSEPGKGSTFEVLLPLVDEARRQESSPPRQALARGAGTVLMIDDEESVRHVVAAMLTSLGYGVVLATNGREGVDYYRDHKDCIDLVVLDLTMPVMDGQECFALLKELDPNVKVVIATGHAREGVAQSVLDKGALQFVQKPFVKVELARAVSKALRGSCA